jgi:CRISPR-associated endonuclease/helicase Cas3
MGRVLRRYGPMASPSDIPEPSEPNVFIWIFKNELNSGRGYVYETDLLLITLKLLSLLKKDKDDYIESENIKNWFDQKMKDAKKNRDKLISFILSEIFGSAYSGEEIFTTRQNENQPKRIRSKAPTNAIVSSSLQKFEFVCSEYDKYEMVKRLYESLPDGGNYMTKFYKTKDLLDAGYMSDRRDEAHKLFREIFTLSVIPSKMREDFIKAVQAFFNIHKNEKKLYTLFKMDVLAKFVVQIPVRFSKIKEWNLDHLEWWIRGQEIEGISEKERKRLLNWCQGIYFIDIAYDSGKGVDTTNLFEPIDTLIL